MKKEALAIFAILGICFLAILLSCHPSGQDNRVVHISDGDTITVMTPNDNQLKIRLAEIDAPESHQAFGNKAKEALANKIFGKMVKVEWIKKDRYGRAIGKIYLNDRYINLEMVKEGWAWQYTEYSHSPEIASAQKYAKQNKLGLWSNSHPIPPWEFRKKK